MLTKKGKKVGEDILEEAQKIMLNIVSPLPVEEQIRLVAAMSTVDRIVNGHDSFNASRVRTPFTIRQHRLGDIGRIIHSYAVQFAADYGWNHEFEAEIAERSAEFIRKFDSTRERCWIAEIDGHLVGSVFLVNISAEVAEARLLYVAPEARGMGIGANLLSELINFARSTGYKKITMRTESILDFASPLFKEAGMTIVKETPHRRFGKDGVGQDWEMAL